MNLDNSKVIGFLFEAKDSLGDVKGYLYGADHSADPHMLKALENERIQNIFSRSTPIYFENTERMVHDLDEICENKGAENFPNNISALDKNPQKFASLIGVHPPDVRLGKTLPGVDYHLLAMSYREKKEVDSLEGEFADQQTESSEETLEKFSDNCSLFLEGKKNPLNSEEGEQLREEEVISNETKLVLEKNNAWKLGDLERYVRILNQLDQGFFSIKRERSDPTAHIIAFNRNRAVDLARTVHVKLAKTEKPLLFVFGTQHLVSSDKINLLSLLKAKGRTIDQIKT